MMTGEVFSFKPGRRVFTPDDPFFEEGNRECIYREKTVDEDIDFIMDKFDRVMIEEFTCSVKGCFQKFRSPLEFNRHFDMIHRFRCEHCGRNFPSNHLLSLHLQENHDALFQTQKEKGVAEFDCIVEGCDMKFGTEELRRKHVIEVHKYPANFRFNAVKRPHTKYKQKGKKSKTPVSVSDRMDVKTDNYSTMDSNFDQNIRECKVRNKKSRKQQIKKDEITMEVTESVDDSIENRSTDMTLDTTAITDSAKASKKVEFKRTLPSSISFGRGTQKGFSRTRRK